MNYVLDTNILIYPFSGQLAEVIPDGKQGYSVITEIELRSFQSLTQTAADKIQQALSLMTRFELNDAVREQTILLRRNHKMKLPDAVIVATAMVQESVLISNDERLHRINGLQTMRLALLQ
jgi:hypothetical protein